MFCVWINAILIFIHARWTQINFIYRNVILLNKKEWPIDWFIIYSFPGIFITSLYYTWKVRFTTVNCIIDPKMIQVTLLKGSVREKWKGVWLNAIKKRFWSILTLLLSVASIRRKLLKTSHTEERSDPYKLRKLQHTT